MSDPLQKAREAAAISPSSSPRLAGPPKLHGMKEKRYHTSLLFVTGSCRIPDHTHLIKSNDYHWPPMVTAGL